MFIVCYVNISEFYTSSDICSAQTNVITSYQFFFSSRLSCTKIFLIISSGRDLTSKQAQKEEIETTNAKRNKQSHSLT